jgi:preprotein translocase subunit SecY
MAGMFQTLRNAIKIPDLRKKLVFTVLMLLIYRIGVVIVVPGIDASQFVNLVGSNDFLGLLDTISGGALQRGSIFAMSITPYINASIIMNLLTVAIPYFEKLQKEGEEGRKKIGQYTRYGTVVLGFLQANALYLTYKQALIEPPSTLSYITITLTFTAGTAFLMWLGEQITEKGVGNGISLLIFAGILSRGPSAFTSILNYYTSGTLDPSGTPGIIGIMVVLLIIVVFLAVIAGVVWVNDGERRIPIQYAKRVVGRKMYGGQSTHLPIKVNLAGVIPIIFAMSITMFPSIIIGFAFPNATGWLVETFKNINQYRTSMVYILISGGLIVFFTYFYSLIQFNPVEVAGNIKKNGGFIPGLRPGKPTSDYIAKVLNRLTLFGGLFLALLSTFPLIMQGITGVSLWFGGTSLLIMVGVALDTVKQIESQMLMRHYKGFLE